MLPDLVQGEFGRTLIISVIEKDTGATRDVSQATITGVLEQGPGPNFSGKAVAGTLTPVSGNTFSWDIAAGDTSTYGNWTVQFKFVIPGGIEFYSNPISFEIIRRLVVTV